MKLISDLMNKGFKPFRKLGNEYIQCKDPYFFSSVVAGKLCVILKLNKKEIWIGLYEKGYAPTLIYPSLGDTNLEIEKKLNTTTIDDIIALA